MRSFTVLCSAIGEWSRTDGLTWLYLIKALAACFLALGVAMKLDLPQPRTAMITVFIVMQPQSGMVLAKSFYRICATLVGLAVTLALVSVFSQNPEMFVASTAIWVGICTIGAARNRNFKSYGFVLAGYTAALIGIPASQHPDSAFIGALTRVAEVIVGILSSGLVSALVFPRHTGDQLQITLQDRFVAFTEYVSVALSGRIERQQVEATNARLIAEVVGFESMRSAAIFETPDVRMRGRRLARLNSEFMTLSTRFYALYQLINRLRSARTREANFAIEQLQPYLQQMLPLLAKAGEPDANSGSAMHVAAQLEAYEAQLLQRINETHAILENRRLEFDTGVELLYRFIKEWRAYTATYASLSFDTHEREHWIERYEPKTNLIGAAAAGLRTIVLTMLLGAFWIATAWPSGLTLTVGATTVTALISSSPNPKRTAFQMTCGALLSSITGMITVFGVYPHIDGFPLLCAALVPFLSIGIWLTTRPGLAGCGLGYLIFFSFLAGPDNVIHYDPDAFVNDALALVLSMAVTTIAFAVMLPPSTPWLRDRLLVDLRRQIVMASRAGIRQVRSRFESGTRDLAMQIHVLAQTEPESKRDALRWLLFVLEVGNAVIDLRKEIASLPAHLRHAESMPWRVSLRAVRDALTALFVVPGSDRLDRALNATVEAVAVIQHSIAVSAHPREEGHRLQRIVSQLHFIRTALVDPQSPLGPYANEIDAAI
ncbi:FUSC family protein [Paraburkholderia jirisanensis]